MIRQSIQTGLPEGGIKATLQVDLIILLDKYGYSPVTIDDVYKEVLEQMISSKEVIERNIFIENGNWKW